MKQRLSRDNTGMAQVSWSIWSPLIIELVFSIWLHGQTSNTSYKEALLWCPLTMVYPSIAPHLVPLSLYDDLVQT